MLIERLKFLSNNNFVDLGININNNILFSNSNHDLMSESTFFIVIFPKVRV